MLGGMLSTSGRVGVTAPRITLLSAVVAYSIGATPGAPDGINMSISAGPSTTEVTLDWTGAAPPFQIFRSDAPQGLTHENNRIAETTEFSWIDLPPAGDLFFYAVAVACVPNPPEVCDGVDNDCDGIIDGPGSELSCDVPHASPVCFNGTCQIGNCDADWSDCDGDQANGCEVNTLFDRNNCGACGLVCIPGYICFSGSCDIP